MTRAQLNFVAVAATALLLAGCGRNQGDRAVSGGLIGAGTGAIIGGIAGGPATGALVGGAVGAVGGAATSPDAINLGKPAWR